VEQEPPEGCVRIEWMLYTNLAVLNFDEAVEKINWYCLRWKIEVYFKVIKSGFHVENCRLESADRLIRYLALISIVAWKVYWLTLAPRVLSRLPTSDIYNEAEWKVLFVTFNPSSTIPQIPPPLNIVTIWIARLGGFLARKNDGLPGITHVWRGLQKLCDMTAGFQAYRKICG